MRKEKQMNLTHLTAAKRAVVAAVALFSAAGGAPLANAKVRVTAISATTSANASATPTLNGLSCVRSNKAGPPSWQTAVSCVIRQNNGLLRRPAESGGYVAVQPRVPDPRALDDIAQFHLESNAFSRNGDVGDFSFTNLNSSASANFSITFSVDTPTEVTVNGGNVYRQRGSLSINLPGLTFPTDGTFFSRKIVAQPPGFTVSGGAAVVLSGFGEDSERMDISFEFRQPTIRKPVLLIPGVGATYSADTGSDLAWLIHRGVPPAQLQIDPMTRVYHDLIKTLEKVGYVKGKDLFIVNYDWRLLPGPDDGNINGRIDGLTAASISDTNYLYAVDYLGDSLRQAAERWARDHPGEPLDAVDVITHSTGGLVARTYVQSGAAYGGEYAVGKNLPKINNLIMIGVPNRGASKAWNPLNDNWVVDPAFQVVLSQIVNRAYQKVLNGVVIGGPDYNINLASITSPQCLDLPEICFLNQYVPTIRGLLATYDFIDFGSGITNVNGMAGVRNSLLLDLNAGLDSVLTGDPNSFADKVMAKPTIIYGTNGGHTPTSVVQRTGPAGSNGQYFGLGSISLYPIANFTHPTPSRDALPGEVWYQDILAPVSGDGTVPLDSSRDQFVGDSRFTLMPFTQGPFTQGGNTVGKVGHTDLPYNVDVQKAILQTLGVPFKYPDDISVGEAGYGFSAVGCAVGTSAIGEGGLGTGGCASFGLDPVEGFMVDAQGRRLGYSVATGAVTEIPGSVWFGNTEGMGWVFGQVEEPVTVKLTGLGENYYVSANIISPTGGSGIVDKGTLALGASRVVAIPATSAAQPPPTPRAHSNLSASAFSEAGYKAYATFDVQHELSASAPSGTLTFTSSKTRRKVVSTGISSLVVSGATAVITGSCTLNGVGGYSYTATVGDQATPGAGEDTFAITITGPNGFSYTVSGTISSGNYTVSGQ